MDDPNMTIRKTSLKNVFRMQSPVDLYRDLVAKINQIATTIWLFVLGYDPDEGFNADVYLSPDCFAECKRLQTLTRRPTRNEKTWLYQAASRRILKALQI